MHNAFCLDTTRIQSVLVHLNCVIHKSLNIFYILTGLFKINLLKSMDLYCLMFNDLLLSVVLMLKRVCVFGCNLSTRKQNVMGLDLCTVLRTTE